MVTIASIEKKARKELRLAKYFRLHDSLLLLHDGGVNSVEFLFSKTLFNELFQGRLNLKIITRLPRKAPKSARLLIPSSIDREVAEGFALFITDTEPKYAGVGSRIFTSLTRKEMEVYLTNRNIRYQTLDDYAHEFLETIEKMYPGTKNTLHKSLKYIRGSA